VRLARPERAVWRVALCARHLVSLRGPFVTVSTVRRLIGLSVGLIFLVVGVVTGAPTAGAEAHIWAESHLAADTATARSITIYDAAFRHSSPTLAAVGASPTGRSTVDAVPPAWAAAPPVAVSVATETGAGALAAPTAQGLGSDLADATGGTLKQLKSGYSVTVPSGNRGIVVRLMEEGGGRSNYYRVSVPGKQAFTVTGDVSTDPALTHIPIGSDSLQDILRIIEGQSP